MPVRKTQFQDNASYHLTNRGIDNRLIFTDEVDYHNFYTAISYYLSSWHEAPQAGAMSRTGLAHTGLFQNKVRLITYCLTPTTYHLILWQKGKDDIKNFMGRVGTAYSMNFNRRHSRSGPLFQGRYKAKWIDTDDYLLQSTKYVHRVPVQELQWDKPLETYPHSSYQHYHRFRDPGYQPLTPLDHLIDPSRPIDHLQTTHQGMDYRYFTESIPFVDWYQHLLDWMK